MAEVSQALLNIVKEFEGCELKAYWDRNHYAIGYGTKANSSSEIITKEEAEKRIKYELQLAVNKVLSSVSVPLNDNQLAALASLAFNAGSIKQFPKLMAALNSSNFNEAANQFLDINKDVNGEELLGLTRRRKAERDLFLGKSSGINNPLNPSGQIGSLAQDAASVISNGLNTLQLGIQSALLTGQNCPPPPYTQQDRITYPGCLQKTTNPIFGNILGSGTAAPGVSAINNQPNNQSQGNVNQSVGNSEPYTGELKPGGMICPVKNPRISSIYGWRIHPKSGKRKFHKGIDFAVPTGTPVFAVADGIVRFTKDEGGYGNSVVIDHPQLGAATRYAHNSKFAVSAGQKVKQGDVIAYSGNTGYSTGPHSHVEVLLKGDKSIDPAKYIKC